MRDRVLRVMASVFDLEPNELGEPGKLVMGSTRNWDSLRHMNLILALEEEFNVRFGDDEVVDLLSFPLIVESLRAKEQSS